MRGRRLLPSKREFRTGRFIQHKRYVGAGEFLIAGLLLVDPAIEWRVAEDVQVDVDAALGVAPAELREAPFRLLPASRAV